MLKKNIRTVQFYDLVLRPLPEQAPPIALSTLIKPLQAQFNKQEAVQLIDNNTAACRIIDLQYDEEKNFLIMLLQYADTKASDPAFSDLQTGAIRVEPKLEGEGIAVSAHVLISLDERIKDSRSYMMLLEKAPGLSRTRVQRFLRYIFKEISDGVFFYKNEKGEEKKCRPLAELLGYPSDSLKSAIETGDLKGVQFVKRDVKNHELDENGYIQEREYITRIKIVPDLSPEIRWRAVREFGMAHF